jgi:hypothetical protein
MSIIGRFWASTEDFDPGDCRAEVFWLASLEMWAMRVCHVPTGIAIVRYAGSQPPRDPFVETTRPSATDDLRWLVTHRGPALGARSSVNIAVDDRRMTALCGPRDAPRPGWRRARAVR